MNNLVKIFTGIIIISLLFIQGCSYSKSSLIKQYDSVGSIKIPRAEYLWVKAEGIYVPKYYLYNDTTFIENTFRYDLPENTIYAYLSAIVNKDWGAYLNSFTERRREIEVEAQRAIGDLPDGVIVNYSIKYIKKDRDIYDVLVEEKWGLDGKIDDSPLIEHIILKNLNGTWKMDFVALYNYNTVERVQHRSSGESEKLFSFQTKDNDCKRQVLDRGFPLKHCIPFYINEGAQNIVIYNEVKTDYFDLDGDNVTDLIQLSIYASGIADEYRLLFATHGYCKQGCPWKIAETCSPECVFSINQTFHDGENIIRVNVTPLTSLGSTLLVFFKQDKEVYSKELTFGTGNAILDLVKPLSINDSLVYLNGTYLLNVTVAFISFVDHNYTVDIGFDPTLTMSDPGSGYEFIEGYRSYYYQYATNISAKKGVNYASILVDLNTIDNYDKEQIIKFDKIHFDINGASVTSLSQDYYFSIFDYRYTTPYYDTKKLLSKSFS